MGRLQRVFGAVNVRGRAVLMPHLYFTYLFMGLLSSFVYHVFGRGLLIPMFSWYYVNGLDNALLALSVAEIVIRAIVINRSAG
jgi:hypothetical protein